MVQIQRASSPTSLDALEPSQESWPKMTRASIQKYAKVFMEVETRKIGRITGEQARKLFLSWRLPREVLKQVWDLSDQDNDSMLSLREFCIALYLMERYREGRTLPSTLPKSLMLDETLVSLAGPPISYGNTGWNLGTGFRPVQESPGSQPGASRPRILNTQQDASLQSNQEIVRGISGDNFQKPGNEEENLSENNDLDNEEITKAEQGEIMLLDSKEKLEFYRTRMQELVLYRSRCDNRLNEITERARADKAEAEALEKKYQEKYKLVAEVHSKLTLEEASYRGIQERKMELHQAIIRIEQGGSADGILQVRADRIQSDLEGLLKALSDRCSKHDFQIKSSTLIELPSGWAPGVPEAALVWDEEWDKFDDEGFSFDVSIPENSKDASFIAENSSPAHSLSPDSVLNADSMSEEPFNSLETAFQKESIYTADDSKSVQDSIGSVMPHESPSDGYTEAHLTRNSIDADTHRSFDDSTWGNFNNDDDIDSAWAFNSKELDNGKLEEKHFFGSSVFAASPERTDSPQGGSGFQKNDTFFFEDSVPNSPLSRAASSPSRVSMESKDPFFGSFSGYDSFSVQSSGSPHGTNLTRFDSVSSTSGFNHNSKYSFDDADPFGSSGPFKVSSETPKNGSRWDSGSM